MPLCLALGARLCSPWVPAKVLSARPMLARVRTARGAALVLTGGRPRLNLWVNWAGDGAAWQTLNLAAAHNAHVAPGGHTFCDAYVHANDSSKVRVEQSPAYNSVVRVSPEPASGAARAVACYSLGAGDLDPGGKPSACVSNESFVYCMRLTLVAAGAGPLVASAGPA